MNQNGTQWRHHFDLQLGRCTCPSCNLGFFMGSLYANQQRATLSVLQEKPPPPPGHQIAPLLQLNNSNSVSSLLRGIGGGGGPLLPLPISLPPPPPPPSFFTAPTTCPMFDAFGFCTYGCTCFLPHVVEMAPTPFICPPSSLEEARDALFSKAAAHMNDYYQCDVCGCMNLDPCFVMKVGEMGSYRYCPNCTTCAVFPQMTYFLEALLDEVGDDYQLYKSEIDAARAAIPDMMKIPLAYEAHRMATAQFAWSLLSPADVHYAMAAALEVLPNAKMLVSVGSGTGYVEHIFNRVVNGVPSKPKSKRDRSSFDAMVALPKLKNGRINIFAFDDILRHSRFSVNVNCGLPSTLLSLDCGVAILLLCWPPFGSPQEEQSTMGFETLRHFHQRGGTIVIYVGDVASTGDWRFHEYLYSHYEILSSSYKVRKEVRRWCPAEMGLVYAGNDTVGVYQLRSSPVDVTNWSWQRM